MKVAEFLKYLAPRPLPDEREDFDHDHSLASIARQHAVHAEKVRVGTAFDWEDVERYQEELARMDREGPGRRSPQDKSDPAQRHDARPDHRFTR